jgi:(p)ppGpp synthase/HD superfamily hydrolase
MTDLVFRAAQLAERAHAGQTRKYTNRPYVTHLARVAGMAMLIPGVDEATICAAWLHDYLEDQVNFWEWKNALVDLLEQGFPVKTVKLLVELTNASKYVDPPLVNRKARKEYDLTSLAKASLDAKRLKVLDRTDNLRELDDAPPDFIRLYLQESTALLVVLGGVGEDLRAALKFEILRLEVKLNDRSAK